MSPLILISILSACIPILAGWRARHSLLWLYACLCLGTDVLISVLRRLTHFEYLWPGNVFVLLEFLLISMVYARQIAKGRPYFYLPVIALAALFVTDTLYKSVWQINRAGCSYLQLVFIVYALAGFYSLLRTQKILQLERSWFFWLNAAFLIYSSGSFFIFLARDILAKQDPGLHTYTQLWNTVFLALNITKNLLLATALYRLGQEKSVPAAVAYSKTTL